MGKDRSADFSAKDAVHILAMAKKYSIPRDQTDLLNVWPLIRIGLAHQGHPRGNLQKMIEGLEQKTSIGWDEFSIDFDPNHAVVEIRFLDQQARCPAQQLTETLQYLQRLVS